MSATDQDRMSLAEQIAAQHVVADGPRGRISFPCTACPSVPMGTELERALHVAEVTEQAALASAATKVTEFATGLARGLNQYPAGTSDYIDGTNDTLADVVEALGRLAHLIDRTLP